MYSARTYHVVEVISVQEVEQCVEEDLSRPFRELVQVLNHQHGGKAI